MLSRICIFLAGLTGGLGVVLGAMEAHHLKGELLNNAEVDRDQADERIRHGEKATEYQIVHAAVLLAVGLLARDRKHFLLCAAAIAVAGGLLLFAGGLHAHAFTGRREFIQVVPYGGGMLIVGWLALGCAGLLVNNPTPAPVKPPVA